MSSHRGTRSRTRISGTQGGATLGRYVRTIPLGKSSNHVSLDWGTRNKLELHRNRIQAAKRRGVHFSTFPTFVRATNLKTGDIGYGRTPYEALSALWAGQGVHQWNVKVLGDERREVWAEYRARMARI